MAKSILLVILLVGASRLVPGQGFLPPSEGKSAVYIVRGNSFQKNISTLVFDGEKFIADFPGTQYFRYECDPGEHIFWASGENIDFVVANLKPNGSYVIFLEALAGAALPMVKATAMGPGHKKLHGAKWLITHKPSVVEDSAVVAAENVRMANFIRKSLNMIKSDSSFHSDEKKMLPEMALPVDKF